MLFFFQGMPFDDTQSCMITCYCSYYLASAGYLRNAYKPFVDYVCSRASDVSSRAKGLVSYGGESLNFQGYKNS